MSGVIMSKSFNYYLLASSIPPYCAAAREIDPTVCGHLRFMNYNMYPNYFNREPSFIRKCRACPHCVGRYAVYPKIIHSFIWSMLCSPEGYSVHFARIKDRINNIDDCLTFTRYMAYLIRLTKNTCQITMTSQTYLSSHIRSILSDCISAGGTPDGYRS